LAEKEDVCALVRPTSNLAKISNVQNVQIIQADSKDWGRIIQKYQPETIILNDWEGVGNGFRNDVRQYDNVSRVLNLAYSAKVSGVKTIVGVGSQAEIGPVQTPITESAPDNPTSIYGIAKVKTRMGIQDLILDTELRFIWMRIFSIYGPLDEGSWLIPSMVDSLTRNEIMRLTKGEQEWSYLHCFDLANAFVNVLHATNVSGIVNVGNPETMYIRDVALKIGDALNKRELLAFGALDYRSDQVMKLQPVCETLIKIGWIPQISFEEGIKQTIRWLTRNTLSPLKTVHGNEISFNLPARQ
jgi:nucleoside-diphosphate-sugar epimerase